MFDKWSARREIAGLDLVRWVSETVGSSVVAMTIVCSFFVAMTIVGSSVVAMTICYVSFFQVWPVY